MEEKTEYQKVREILKYKNYNLLYGKDLMDEFNEYQINEYELIDDTVLYLVEFDPQGNNTIIKVKQFAMSFILDKLASVVDKQEYDLISNFINDYCYLRHSVDTIELLKRGYDGLNNVFTAEIEYFLLACQKQDDNLSNADINYKTMLANSRKRITSMVKESDKFLTDLLASIYFLYDRLDLD